MEYEVNIAEPKRFEFDINLTFFVDNNPFNIRIENFLGGRLYDKYKEIDTEILIDLEKYKDHLFVFRRDNFKVYLFSKRPEEYDFQALSSMTLIDGNMHYIALNKLRKKLKEELKEKSDIELALFQLLKEKLVEGIGKLELYIESKRVEEQFNKEKV